MDNKFLLIGISIELILLYLVLIKIKNSKKRRTLQPPLPKEVVKNLKFK